MEQKKLPHVLLYMSVVCYLKYILHANTNSQIYLFLHHKTTKHPPVQLYKLIFYILSH